MQKVSLATMKKICKEKGSHYFAKGAMEFFNSKIESEPNQYSLFIESQQYETDVNNKFYTPRKYFVKYFNSSNANIVSISEVSSQDEYIATLEGAFNLRNIIAKAFSNLANRENEIMDNLTFVEMKKDWITFYGNVKDHRGEIESKSFDVSYDGRICG